MSSNQRSNQSSNNGASRSFDLEDDIPITSRGRFMEDDFFQQARDRFHRQMTQFRSSWDEGDHNFSESERTSRSFRNGAGEHHQSSQHQFNRSEDRNFDRERFLEFDHFMDDFDRSFFGDDEFFNSNRLSRNRRLFEEDGESMRSSNSSTLQKFSDQSVSDVKFKVLSITEEEDSYKVSFIFF